ncbi:MAG: BspA family leucine-rich repeat surface protein [Saprospiraceae bacterium]|nr:BspA family leucine-rich repeat surface protein [Saprospiraceae bacterium]
MKWTLIVLSMILTTQILQAQNNLEVEGKMKIGDTPKDNTADSILVRLEDGTLGIRDVSSLIQYQVLSISNDSIFLSNGGFIKLPAAFDGQYSSLTGSPTNVSSFANDAGFISTEIDGSVTNEIQTISRSGLTITLSDGGGTFQDSINVYTAGDGIDIDNNVITNTIDPGETNTATNVGIDGVGVFKQKTNGDLEFKKVNAGSSKVTITDDVGADEVDVDINESNINIANLTGAPSSDVVGISDAQTITNKVISATSNTISGLTSSDVGLNTTDDLPEGSNLYYADGRFDTRLSTKSTSDLLEGSNLYYTEGRADSRIALQKGAPSGLATLDASGKVPVNQLSLSSVSYQGNWDASTNTPAVTDGAGTQGNYYVVSSAGSTDVDGITDWQTGDWIVFNGTMWQKVDNSDQVTSVAGKQGVVTLVSADITDLSTSNVVEGANYYYTDGRFDTRLNTKSTSDVAEGSNLYYTNARFDSRLSSKSTSDVAEGNNLYFTDGRADSRIALQKGAASGLATLDGAGKIPSSQLSLSSVSYQGNWDAGTNSPTMTDGVGSQGNYYVVSNAGSSSVDGITDWQIGDWIVFNGSAWQKVDNSDQVTSVAGKQGVVTLVSADISDLSTSNVSEGSNLYYTDGRFDTRLGTKSTSDVAEGTNLYYTNVRADGRITNQKGMADGLATLDGSGKIPASQLPVSNISHLGDWDADSNSPLIAGGVGSQGNYYVVSVSGNTNIDGIADWQVGDWIVFSNGAWQKADHTSDVTSVAGKQGVVTLVSADITDLSTTNVTEGSNLYYTDGRFDTRLSSKTTSDVTEGANLYYTDGRFDTRLGMKSTSNLAEGTNLYYTDDRVEANTEVSANSTHRAQTDNPHAVTKIQVGLGNVENTKVKLDATAAPTSIDDGSGGYSIGSRWIDVTLKREYVCVDATTTAAIWKETTNTNEVYLGQDTLGGIVFHIYKGDDGLDHGLIVAKTEAVGKYQASTTVINADRTWDGSYNMDLMEEDLPGPPLAKDQVQLLGADWYLPSLDELIILWNNRFQVNRAMFSGGHTLMSKVGFYWSSTEFDANFAWTLNNLYGYVETAGKTSSDPKVRGIRAF